MSGIFCGVFRTLDFITRFHAHVLMNTFTFAFAHDMFGIFCGICRNQPMAPRFYYRFHVHVLRNAFTFAFAYDMFGIFCEICRNQSINGVPDAYRPVKFVFALFFYVFSKNAHGTVQANGVRAV